MKIQSKYGDTKQNGVRLLRTFIIAENDTKIFFNKKKKNRYMN